MTMKSIKTLSLPIVGAQDKLERGDLRIEKGKGLKGIFVKAVFALANASGGSVTLTDTQRQSFISGYRFWLTYGRNQRRKPYNSMLGTTLERISRFFKGQDWEGYADSSTGLARALPNSATTSVTLWIYVPTMGMWHDRGVAKLRPVGRSQAATMELELKREADTLPSGVTVSGTPSITLYPDVEPSRYDGFTHLAEWYEVDEVDKIARGPKGLHLLVAEDTAALTSTSLTNVELRMGKHILYTGVSPDTAYKPTLQIPNIPAEADISDRTTVLFQWTPGMPFEEMPVGGVEVEQITKDLATFKLRGLYIPIVPDTELREELQELSGKKGRNKPLKAVNAAVVQGVELPPKYHAFTGAVLFDADNEEFQRFPGLVGQGDNAPVDPYIPDSVLDNARSAIAQKTVKGEVKNAEAVFQRVALACWGAIQDPEGFDERSSPILDQVRVAVRG